MLVRSMTPVAVALLAVLVFATGAEAAPREETPAKGGLQQEVDALKGQVEALSADLAAALERIDELEADLAAVEANKALELGPYVEVVEEPLNDVTGPNIVFTGANLHVRSGSGATNDNIYAGGSLTGLGNLIVGYNELPTPHWETPDVDPRVPGYRGRSHNVVLGTKNSFYGSGGFVGGQSNAIHGHYAGIFSGNWGTATDGSVVVGGFANDAEGWSTTVVGGQGNRTVGGFSSILGGVGNETPAVVPPPSQAATYATIVGGAANEVTGRMSSVLGGGYNSVSGQVSATVGAGTRRTPSMMRS